MNSSPRSTRQFLTAGLSALALLAAGCGGSDGAASAAGGGDAPECGFSEELVAAAQEEGQVTIYAGGHTRETLERLTEMFQDAYGITVTSVREDSGAVVRMVQAELAAGNLNADVISLADIAAMAELAEDGALMPSEAPNLDEFIAGVDDPETPQIPYAVTPLGIMYNEAVTIDPPNSWQELADYDGTIVVADPNASGTSLLFFSMLTEHLGDEWLAKLADGSVTVTDSSLALAQLVLTGEADVAVPAIESTVIAAAAGGEPLAAAFPEDAVPTFSSELAALAGSPHPNAAKLLVGYHVCEAFQQSVAEQGGRPILEGAPAPEGVADLGGAELLSPDLEQLATKAEPLRARFTELFG
ncbi:ABC transporter substrate-binding protein [Pseudonocardia nigra]|uniref:ABC transporter substrate-binding protein n=1 Tax=Pseudonocardia nigra TaxID=1921578 RepID=UPI001C5FA78E|nr:extracellular solute-binding protein [Pseudonocardia nigra]